MKGRNILLDTPTFIRVVSAFSFLKLRQASNHLMVAILVSIFFLSAIAVARAATVLEHGTSQRMVVKCPSTCKFRLCSVAPGNPFASPFVLLRDANNASFPFICHPDFTVLNILQTGEAIVKRGEQMPVRISQYQKNVVSPNFARDYFKTVEIRFPVLPNRFGLSRSMSKGNQEEFLDRMCGQLPIKKYTIEPSNPTGAARVIQTNDPDDCVSFLAVRPLVLLELVWDNGHDLDLTVFEPDGNRIYFRAVRSAASGGLLLSDFNVGFCGQRKYGRERIRWGCDSRPNPGQYRVQARHWNDCGGLFEQAKWSLSIIINGRYRDGRSGVTSGNGRDQVLTNLKFQFTGPFRCRGCGC